jgi:DNA repair exonuclease SbcCD ATPase subunit/predicted MPP superfamily phosphohydrolase
MRTINIGLDRIDKIYHIADVHVRNVKRHKEYEQVFKKLYTYIRKTHTPNSVIYLAGDIVHAKTDMSPELVYQVSTFFKRLADIAPVLLITGNHDCNLNNSSRLDALSPIVKALNHPNLHYLKDTDIYLISGIHFNVMSVFDKPVDFIRASDFEGNYKIALHHGAVNMASTDAGFTLSNTHVTTELFAGHDLVLLGDIHKPQFLNENKTIAYAGSLVQQNHGEALGHGIMVWDIESKSCEFVEIENDFGYYTFEVDNGVIINPSDKVPPKPRLRLKIKDTSTADIKEIVSKIKQQYKVQEISIQKLNALNTNIQHQKISFGDVREVEWQNNAITEYLSDEHALDEEMLDCVRHINRTVHSKLPDSELTRNVIWTPKYFEFSNMFSYGEGNTVDFSNVSGTYGLFAPNASGKSTLLDALSFCCFDKCSRAHKAVNVLNNKKSSFTCKFHFDLDGKNYFIERVGRKNNKGHVKVDVNFWHEDANGNITMLNGEQRDGTNKIIRQYLGSYDDFVLTALSLQNNNTGFIDKSQRERKELLSQFLDIDIFERQYQIANEDIRDTSALIREYKRTDHSETLADAERVITQSKAPLERMLAEKREHESIRDGLNDIIVELTKELRQIDVHEDKDILMDRLNLLEAKRDEIQLSLNDERDALDGAIQRESDLHDRLEQFNVSELENEVAHVNEFKIEAGKVQSNINAKQRDIDHAEKMLSKLEKHRWNPDCEYCMANPWLQDTQRVTNQLPILKEELSLAKNKLNDIESAINNSTASKRLAEYNQCKNDYISMQRNVLTQRQLVETIQENQLPKIDAGISQQMQLVDAAIQHEDDIKFNKAKNKEITEVRDEITGLNDEIRTLDDNIMHFSGKLQIAKREKEEALAAIERLRELEIQYKGYEYYLKAVKRDGVPYQLISKALPQIEAEINNILTQIVDFTVLLETDGKNINGYIVYDEDNYWPLELTSGMEKFISSLAIRTSLINVTSLPRPNFLAIDEGFGVLDSDNLNSMYMLFDYLKSQFEFMLCISHIDAMRDVVDKLIEIKKTNGYSKINYS